jgi:lysozyme
MTLHKINAAGIELIKRHEGLRLAAYLCPANVWTIGYGHTGDVKPEHRITEHQADVLLAYDLARFESDVSLLTRGIELNENEFSALVSFAFNVGSDIDDDSKAEGLGDSSLLRKLRAGHDRREVAAEFDKWVHAAGRVLPGLVKRRADERALFLTPVRS